MHRYDTPEQAHEALRRTPGLVIGRELLVGVPLCVGVAGFLSAVFGDSFAVNVVFSLCIGLSIQALTEIGRFALAAWLARRRDSPELRARWPGWRLMVPWILGSVVIGYAFGATLATALTGRPHLHGLFTGNLRALTIITVVVLLVSLGTTYFFYLRGRMLAFEAQAEAERRAGAETQLKLLQSQLEPHMLFNTLANLRVLIGLDPAQAQAMLDRLIAFLRATLSASRADRHPLAAEFERTADYLALMAVRMGPRLQVHLNLPDDLRDLPVPPLLLQPLVENSIQHGLEPKVEGGRIDVRAERVGARLVLTVRDDGLGLPQADTRAATAGTGFGTTQVRERLAALYGHGSDAARFTLVAAAGGGTLATLDLPLPADPPAAPTATPVP